jgi:hypothetical protein
MVRHGTSHASFPQLERANGVEILYGYVIDETQE